MRNVTSAVSMVVLAAVGFLPATLLSEAQKSSSPSPGMEMQMPMPSVLPLFIESADFSSVLNLVNELNIPLNATVEIYSLNGEKVLTKAVAMKPYSLQRLGINSMLASSGINLELGSIRLSADHTAGLLAALSFTHLGSSATYFDEEPSMPSSTEGSNIVRGVADDARDRSPITAITSVSSMSQTVTVTCLPEKGSRREQSFELGANQTALTRPCSYDLPRPLISASEMEEFRPIDRQRESREAAGIAISSDGMPGSFAAYGVVAHRSDSDSFFTSVNFSDPKTRQSNGSALVGIPVGPSALLTEGSYKPELAITNFGPKTATINLESAATLDGKPESATIATFPLLSGATKTIDLSRMPQNPGLTNSLLIRTDAAPGDVLSKLVSRGNGRLPVVEMLEKDQQDGANAGGHPWSVESGTTSTLLLFNHDSTAKGVNLRFGTPSGTWAKRYMLDPMETVSIGINALIASHEKDDAGKPLSLSAKSGELGWQADSSLVTGRIIQADPALAMARNFSCNQWIYACSFYFSPDPSLALNLNNSASISETPEWALYTGFHPPTSCGCGNSSGGGPSLYNSWSSGNTAIANITSGASSSTSNWNGAGMGTTTTNFSGTTQFSGGGSLTCSYAEPAVTYTTRPGQFNGKCDGTTQNAATLDVTFPSGTILSNSDTEVGDITTTGNVDIVANSESSSVLGVDAYAKFKYFAGPGTVGEQVGTVTIPFLVNATKLGIIPVKPMIPVICQ